VSGEGQQGEGLPCRRCGRAVVSSAEQYDVFEQMHYTCFHYEFEHPGDPDVECAAGGCPAAGIALPSIRLRVEGVELSAAGDTVVPAILALRGLGFMVESAGHDFVARLPGSLFRADDPVAVLGLVKLAEVRLPWRATDNEIDEIVEEFGL
jgi:hypothetical protein